MGRSWFDASLYPVAASNPPQIPRPKTPVGLFRQVATRVADNPHAAVLVAIVHAVVRVAVNPEIHRWPDQLVQLTGKGARKAIAAKLG